MMVAFERVWGDEETKEKPTARRVLRALLTILADRRLTLGELPELISHDDPTGFRRWASVQFDSRFLIPGSLLCRLFKSRLEQIRVAGFHGLDGVACFT